MVDSGVSSSSGFSCRWVPDPLHRRLPKQERSDLNRCRNRSFEAPSRNNKASSEALSKPQKCRHIVSCLTEGSAYGSASVRHRGSLQFESYLFARPCLDRRRPNTMSMMPTTAITDPMESHMRLPVMKLPGIRFMPCPANTPPRIRTITPTVIRAMRPIRLVMYPNLPSTGSRRRSNAPKVSARNRTATHRER